MQPHAEHHEIVTADLTADVADLAARAQAASGLTSFSDELWHAFRDGSANTVLSATNQQDTLVGVAFSAPRGDRVGAELLVDPEHRGQGYGGSLLTNLLDDRDGELWVWSHGDHPAAATLALQNGLERARSRASPPARPTPFRSASVAAGGWSPVGRAPGRPARRATPGVSAAAPAAWARGPG